MKKCLTGVLGILTLVLGADAVADTNWGTRAGSSADLYGAPSTRTRETVNYKKYKTTKTQTYQESDAGDLYYTKPQSRSTMYKEYRGAGSASATETKKTVRKTRSETVIAKMQRKYFLAHPFYQPLKGKFGMFTDISYAENSYDFTLNGLSLQHSENGKWESEHINVKEDFSFGITDRVALVAMVKYNNSDYAFKWQDSITNPDEKMNDDGFNLFGIGAQWRFVDNAQWIATASAYYQRQQDVSHNFLVDIKGGYKIEQTTLYGLGRAWLIRLDENSYGDGVETTGPNGEDILSYIPYQVGDKTAFYTELGAGVFSVLNKDWTLNVEAILGNYDWHTQGAIKGAIGWQPNDWFALNLYGKFTFYDNADDKNLDFWVQNTSDPSQVLLNPTRVATADLDNYSEMNLGVQILFEF